MKVLLRLCCIATLLVAAACKGVDGNTLSDSGGTAEMSGRGMEFEKPTAPALPDGAQRLRGVVVGGGAPCVQFRTLDGLQISLEGASPQTFPIGARFEITGQFVTMSRCMQGPGFVVTDQNALTDTPENIPTGN